MDDRRRAGLDGANHEPLVAAGARPETNGRDMCAHVADVRLAPPTDVAVELADVGAWLELAVAYGWEERASFEQVYRTLLGDRFRLTIARLGDEVAGLASAFYGSASVLMTQVIVGEAFRRRGVATALVAERIEHARELGLQHAVLGPSPDGAKLYAALGFELRPTPPNRWYYLPLAPEEFVAATQPAR